MSEQDVLDTICSWCGGVPFDENLPFWVYDDYTECECPSYDEYDENDFRFFANEKYWEVA